MSATSKESQCAKVIEYIKLHGRITRIEADRKLGIINLPARIADLKKKFVIKTEYDFLLDEEGRKVAKYAIYSLASEEDLI